MLISLSLIIAVVPYLALTLWLHRGWNKLPRFENQPSNTSAVQISVVIPMRDEAQNIGQLLNDCVRQEYPCESFRIFVVDDHSTDSSAAIVEAFACEHPNVVLLNLPDGMQGKKAALRHVLPHLCGELVATTDADCRLPTKWLSNIAAYYATYHPAMIICPVMFAREHSFFSRWQALEMISLTGSSAATASWGHPIMCSGANLVIERDVMERHAYIYNSHVASGDDMMMMFEIKKKYPERIKYLKSTHATLETIPQPNLKSFIRQRNRWTSKSSKYTDRDVIIIALIVFLANLSVVACLIAGFFSYPYLWLATFIWFFKILFDAFFLSSLTNFWKRSELMWIFLPAQLLYPFYVVWVGIAGNIAPVKWKGRKSKV